MTITKTGARLGRPPTGKTPIVGLRLPADETAEIDLLIGELGDDRSAVLRELIKLGLLTVKRRKARKR